MEREARSERLVVKMSATEMRRLDEEAERTGQDRSEIVRNALDWWWLTGSRYAAEVTAELAQRLMKMVSRRVSRRSASA